MRRELDKTQQCKGNSNKPPLAVAVAEDPKAVIHKHKGKSKAMVIHKVKVTVRCPYGETMPSVHMR